MPALSFNEADMMKTAKLTSEEKVHVLTTKSRLWSSGACWVCSGLQRRLCRRVWEAAASFPRVVWGKVQGFLSDQFHLLDCCRELVLELLDQDQCFHLCLNVATAAPGSEGICSFSLRFLLDLFFTNHSFRAGRMKLGDEYIHTVVWGNTLSWLVRIGKVPHSCKATGSSCY